MQSALRRAARLADTFLPLTRLTGASWSTLREPDALINIPASSFFRPYSPALRRLDPLRLRRLKRGLEHAARHQRVFHLWWHPHNFGRYPRENLTMLREFLDHYAELRQRFGLESLSMADVADRLLAPEQPEPLITQTR